MIREEETKAKARHPVLFALLTPIDKAIALVVPSVQRHPKLYLLTFIMSVVVIMLFSWVLVEAGVVLATTLGVPGAIIGLTVLAVGTSVPDLMASLAVARQGKADMAVSNAVGSNIFDILIGLGAVWMVMIYIRGEPIHISITNLNSSIILLFATVASLMVLLVVQRWSIGRKSGIVLIGIYGVYLLSAVMGWV